MTNVDVTEIQGNFSEWLSRVQQQGKQFMNKPQSQAVFVLSCF